MMLDRRALATLAAALVVSACATEPERLVAPKVVAGLELAPYAIHEECIALRAGQRIGYRFIVEPAIAFNIHYHEAGTVIMPLAVKRTQGEDGDFTADHEQGYCLMWEVDAAAAVLSYRVERLAPRP